jgi:hypothetical protein
MKRLAIILIIGLLAIFCFFKLATSMKKPEPLSISPPVSEPGSFKSLDQSYLKISLLPNSYEISLFEHKLTTSSLDSIQAFISANKNLIDNSNVAVVGRQDMQEFQAVTALLKNNGITQFRWNTK